MKDLDAKNPPTGNVNIAKENSKRIVIGDMAEAFCWLGKIYLSE